MKKYILAIIILFTVTTAFAQEVDLSDSVIYFDKKPVAYYVKGINTSAPHYDMYISGLDKKLLLKAEVNKFEAPIRELKPFYYYNLVFTNEKDTLAIYQEGQAFTIELATLLSQYHLLDGNKINKDSLSKFKLQYKGKDLLQAKINEFADYLDENRFFDEQVVRDRTKPITIVDDRTIMQDGKNIGVIAINSDPNGRLTFANVKTPQPIMGITTGEGAGEVSYKNMQVWLPTQRMVDASNVLIVQSDQRNGYHGPHSLYDNSIKSNKSYRNESVLWAICQLVENYLL